MTKQKQITDEEFDNILANIVIENAATLLSVPGVYEAVSEYFNNEILDRFDNDQT